MGAPVPWNSAALTSQPLGTCLLARMSALKISCRASLNFQPPPTATCPRGQTTVSSTVPDAAYGATSFSADDSVTTSFPGSVPPEVDAPERVVDHLSRTNAVRGYEFR